jgi:pimeloyl-ACP methyl ester carboxylesterase/peptidoglycan hydrolase-like protein with peptidoglycan-binding domain
MSRQTEWLFEVPVAAETTQYTNLYTSPEHFSNPEWESEWELAETYPLNEEEWEIVGRLKVPRRSMPPRSQGAKVPRSRPSSCPPVSTQPRIVGGWTRYKGGVQELPPDQLTKLRQISNEIRLSYRPGCQPVRKVQIHGHADVDTPPNPKREKQMSDKRAQTVRDWLKKDLGSQITAQIVWETQGFGATQLKTQPTTEANRRQNRRVEISISTQIEPPICPYPPTKSQHFNSWLQRTLNQAIGMRLPINGQLNQHTQRAVKTFQARQGLTPNGALDQMTLQALFQAGDTLPPCVLPTNGGGTPIPVIIVPGIMGSRLETPDGTLVWNPLPKIRGFCSIGFGTFAANFERLKSFSPLIPREQHDIPPGSLGGIVGCPTEFAQANAIPHFGNLIFRKYNRLAFDLNDPLWQAAMLAGQSIKVYACGYDWRQDNADSARRLDAVVKQALAETGAEQVILVAHSMGGLVSRYYCKTGGASKVMGLILVASPTHGAPQAYRMLKEGVSLFMDPELGGLFALTPRFELMQMMRRFRSAYQLLPSRHYCLSQPDWLQFAPGKTPLPDASKAVALYSDPYVGFLDGLNGGPALDPFVKDALARRQRFDEALFDPSAGCYMPRNTFLIFSNDIDTEAKYRLEERGSLGSKVLSPFNVVPLSNAPGDETVPEFSATAASCIATRFAFRNKVKHGDLPNDLGVINAVKSIIRTLLIVRTPTTRSSRPLSIPIRR